MHRLRTKGGRGVLVAMMLTSLVPLVVTPTAQEALHRSTTSYSDWLRAQLRVAPDAAIEAAFSEAEDARARTPHAFVEAFVEAYAAQHPAEALAGAFSALNLSHEALIAFLQGRIARLAGQALLPRVLLLSAHVPANANTQRLEPGLLTVSRVTITLQAVAQRAVDVWPLVAGVRILSAAQPLGP